MKKAKLNGGIDALALAMQQVFKEVMEVNNQPIMEKMDGMEGRLCAPYRGRIRLQSDRQHHGFC